MPGFIGIQEVVLLVVLLLLIFGAKRLPVPSGDSVLELAHSAAERSPDLETRR